MRDSAGALILVSHSAADVKDMCTRAVWIERGVIKDEGTAAEVLKRYSTSTQWAPIRLRRLSDPATVSVVMAIKNEAAHIEQKAIDAVLAQTDPSIREIVVAIAPSSDGTHDICQRLEQEIPKFRAIPNPVGLGEFRVERRHSGDYRRGSRSGRRSLPVATKLRRDFDQHATDHRRRSRGRNPASGRHHTIPTRGRGGTGAVGPGSATPISISAASPGRRTPGFGCISPRALDAVGGYNESLLRNQDYDLNWRIREAGGAVWFTPELVVDYQPRDSMRELGSQYFQYGWWKRIMLQQNPKSLRARQAAPPLLVLTLSSSVVAAGWMRRPALLALVALYAAGVAAAGVSAAGRRPIKERISVIIAPMTMHLSWGVGFISSAILRRRDELT